MAFLNQTGTGRVLDIRRGEVLVEDENGFEDWYPAGELVPRKKLEFKEVKYKDQPPRSQNAGKSTQTRVMEVDLHFAQLVEFPKNYTRWEMVQIQLQTARQAVDKARRSGIKTLILIHGVGEGRLREEIHQMLERMDRLQFYDASYAKYGQGATEVELS